MDWHVHWEIVIQLLVIEGLYLAAIGPLRQRFVYAEHVRPSRAQAFMFTAGLASIFVAEATPLHEMSEQFLLSAHMVQHLLLISLAVPMMIVGTPAWLYRPLLEHPLAGPVFRWSTRPFIALVLFNVTLAVWHLPQLYDWALWNHNAHILEHLMFIYTAACMWWPILSPLPELPRLSYPLQIVYLFVQSLVPGIIAALITFSDRVIYPTYGAAARVTDMSALADQQMAGLIMKLAGTFVLWLAAAVIWFIWANHDEHEPGYGEITPPLPQGRKA